MANNLRILVVSTVSLVLHTKLLYLKTQVVSTALCGNMTLKVPLSQGFREQITFLEFTI